VDDRDEEKEFPPSSDKSEGFGINFAVVSMLTYCWHIGLGKDRDHAL
jgi:hypothetical protein